MAYFDGDMDTEQMPIVDRMDTDECTIYVNSFPPWLNKDGIRDIFGQYGEIMAIYISSNRTWAYITYKTYREAEFAIRELNDREPLCLKVALSKKEKSFMREEKKSNRSEINFENSNVVVNTADSLLIHSDMRYMGHDQQSIRVPHKHLMPQITPSYRCADYGSLPHVNEIENPYMNLNKLWTRSVITVMPDGKRHVSLGHGYTFYEYLEPYPKIEESISKAYEQRANGLYEYPENKFKNQVHSCSVCSIKTLKYCEKCHMYYGSKACQLEDWPRHQAECERIPALMENVNGILLQINQSVNQIKKALISNVSKTAKSASDVKLQQPNTFNATQAESSSNMSGNINTHKIDAEITCNSVNNIQDKHVSAQHDNDINISQTKMADQSIVNTTNIKEYSQQHRLQRYIDICKNIDQSKTNNGCSSPSTSTDQSHHSHNYQSDLNKTTFKERYDNDSNVRDRTYDNNRNTPQKSDFQNDKGSVNYNDRENTNRQSTSSSTSMNNDFYKDTHLSKTKFVTVEVVIPLKNGEYWVSKLEDADARINLMVKLQNVVKNSRKLQPIVGEVYGVMYDSFWYRALVKSLNPTMVHYIDFGNDEKLEENADIRDIGDLIKSPKFARKIRLTQGTSDKYRNLQENDKISVRMLSMDSEKTIIVEVEEEKPIAKNLPSYTPESTSNNAVKEFVSQENSRVSPNKNTKVSMVEVPTVLDVLAQRVTKKLYSYIQIHEFKNNIYSATLSSTMVSTEMGMIFNDMQEECTKIQTSTNYKPSAEDLVCGYWNKEWHRGFISTSETSKRSITAIDLARTVLVDEILPCPQKFLNVFSFGITCQIKHSTIKLEAGEVYEFTASINETTYKHKSLKIEIIANSEMIQAVVKPWNYANLLPSFELKNGSKVCLTNYRNHYCMFVRSLEEEEVEHYNNVMQSVAQYAQTAPCVKSPLDTDVVIAPFEDGNSYRAIIIKTYNDKATIAYIDFGNVTEIDVKDLKVMPQLCSLQKSCATKIFLKDVPHGVPLNQEVDIYLRNLLGKEVPLIYTFEGSSKNGIRLTTLTGECVNDKINQLLISGWKKENNDDNTCYMLSDIKIASLGRVGDTVEALVLSVRKDDGLLQCMIGPLDFTLVTHIIEVMPLKLKEYCEKTKYYIPRAQELCLVFFGGIWYRAACLNPKESYETSEIFFIDYGNIESIKHTDIRLMPKDFIVPEALANLCIAVNLAPVDSNGKYSKAIQEALKKMIQPNTTINIKIVECLESGDYKIELPDIRAKLIKYRLVKSS